MTPQNSGLAETLNKCYHTSFKNGYSMSKMCPGKMVKKKSQNSQPTQIVRYFKYISPIKLIAKYCIHVFCIQFSVALETVNPKISCSSGFQKVNIQLKCFFF